MLYLLLPIDNLVAKLKSLYDTALVILGPGTGSQQAIINFLKEKVDTIFIIGDGESSILIPDGKGGYEGEYNKILKIPTLEHISDKSRTLVIIDAHGKNKEDGTHILEFGIEAHYPSLFLFKDLNDAFLSKPLDIVFTPCQGAGALKDINVLPRGSRIAFFSAEDQLTLTTNFDMLLKENFPSDALLSLDNIFSYYLFHLLSYKKPILAEVGGKIIDPYSIHQSLVGNILTFEEKEYAKIKLLKLCSREDDICESKVLKALTSLTEVSNLSTLQKHTYSKAQEEFANLIINYVNLSQNFIDYQKCSIYDIELKKQSDKIFDSYSIPLSFSLEDQLLEIEMEDEMEDQVIELFSDFDTDHAFYTSMLTSTLCEKNDKFPIPKAPEHGLVLLAAMYVEEYADHFSANTMQISYD